MRILVLLLISFQSFGQCDCDFIISLNASEYFFDGVKKGVKPGDKICFASGTRTGFEFRNIKGTKDLPVIITNMCDGQVTLNAPAQWGNVVSVLNSSNFILHGASNPAVTHGIKITGGHMGLNLQGRTTDAEVKFTEVFNVGCSGILAKTDPTCDPATWRGNFTMQNIYLHHNKIYNTGCEGFYIGNSHYDSYVTKTCNGAYIKLYEHDCINVEVAYNELTNIGNDGIQVGSVVSGALVHHNTVNGAGVGGSLYHQNLMQIGGGTQGAQVFANVLKNGKSSGIIDGGGGNTYYDNVVDGVMEAGFMILNDVNPAPTGYRIYKNTVMNAKQNSVFMYTTNPDTTLIYNNIFIGTGPDYKYIGYNYQPNTRVKLWDNHMSTVMPVLEFTISAGDDIVLTGKDYVQLNATAFSPSGIDRYKWTKVSGPVCVQCNLSRRTLCLTEMPKGNYVYKLKVYDKAGLTKTDTVNIKVD